MTPTSRELVHVFGRIGLMSFGGPAAQIALMHRELVENRPWLDEAGFLRALSLCMLLPGPEAMQLATYAGWRLRGVPGGLIAGGLFVLPGALIIAALVVLYAEFGQVPVVQSVFLGIKAAVVIIVLHALRNLSRKALTGPSAWIIAGLAFVAIFALNQPFPLIIGGAAIWGYVSAPRQAAPPQDSPPVPMSKTLSTLGIWLALWLGPLVVLTLAGYRLLAEIGWFFAWLAVVTFGGAYAVLAYMTQTIVEQYQWISTAQMIDALGLAETTPGPLILVTQFVAMLTGQINGGFMLSLATGLVALWATFIPCFLWIFLAAPYLERLAARPRLTGALQAITAAVVGVILNLSVWFALHVLFGTVSALDLTWGTLPLPVWSSLDPVALVLSLLAGLWMLGLKRSLPETLALCACAGGISHFL